VADDITRAPATYAALLHEDLSDLYEHAPCGYLSTDGAGVILKVNETFLELTGHGREELLGTRRFLDLLTPGGRIFYETHFRPLLRMQRSVREIALESTPMVVRSRSSSTRWSVGQPRVGRR
jgi:phosphoserine phosphatase RsbU/P